MEKSKAQNVPSAWQQRVVKIFCMLILSVQGAEAGAPRAGQTPTHNDNEHCTVINYDGGDDAPCQLCKQSRGNNMQIFLTQNVTFPSELVQLLSVSVWKQTHFPVVHLKSMP